MEKKISIIVPIYNTEKFLEKCITSILSQTYKNIEVVLIDDGSIDSSGKICDMYAKLDQRVVVVHKVNEGLVSARKEGIKYATGSYVGFVDSDDWIESNMVSELVKFIEDNDVDMVSSGFMNEKGIRRIHTIQDGTYSGEDLVNVYSRMIFDFEKDMPGIIQSVCTKLFQTNLLKNIIKSLDNKLTLGEDASITYNFLLRSRKIVITNQCYYFYRTNMNSMRFKYNPLIFEKIFVFQEYMKRSLGDYYYKYNIEQQLKLYIEQFIRMVAEQFFDIKYRDSYILPEDILCNYSNVVLYGAGVVGISYYRKFLKSENVKVIKWVDKKLYGKTIMNCVVSPPEEIVNLEYDIILVAVQKEDLANSIIQQLVDYGIKKNKIIWKKPEKEILTREIYV